MSLDQQQRDRSIARRVAPAVGLFLLAPLCGEYVIGNVPLRQLGALAVLAPMYGGGALVIREVARRTGRGWPTILLLGAAYGLFEAGIVDRSLFNPFEVEGVLDTSVAEIPVLGVSAQYSLVFVTGHAFVSIAMPIALVEALVSDRRITPWLGDVGLGVAAALYLVGCLAVGLWAAGQGSVLGPAQAVGTVIATAALVVAALLANPRPLPAAAPPAPAPLRVGVVVFLLAAANLFVPDGWASATLTVVVLVVGLALMRRWSRRKGWSDRHRLAATGGLLVRYAAVGVMFTAMRPHPHTFDIVGNAVLALGALTLLALATRAVRRTDLAARHAVGPAPVA